MNNKSIRKKAFAIVIFCLIVLITWSCSNTASKRTVFITNPEASKSFTEGKWYISSFRTKGNRQKKPFEGYRFTFTDENCVKIYAHDKLFTGEWWVTGETGDKATPDSDLLFNLLLSHTSPLKYLNRKWEILERKPKLLRLLSTETGDWEYVVFEKKID